MARFPFSFLMLLLSLTCIAQKEVVISTYPPLNLTITTPTVVDDTIYHYTVSLDVKGKHRLVRVNAVTPIFYAGFLSDTCLVSPVDIDGKGLPELMLSYSYQAGGAGAMSGYSEVRIWSLDLGKEIFQADTSSYRQHLYTTYGNSDLNEDSFPLGALSIYENCSWSYKLNISRNKIMIDQLRLNNDYEERNETGELVHRKRKNADCIPDHEEGVYLWEKNKFVRQVK
jgi:hypothetical protein